MGPSSERNIRRAHARNVRSLPTFYISVFISTLPTQHTTFISFIKTASAIHCKSRHKSQSVVAPMRTRTQFPAILFRKMGTYFMTQDNRSEQSCYIEVSALTLTPTLILTLNQILRSTLILAAILKPTCTSRSSRLAITFSRPLHGLTPHFQASTVHSCIIIWTELN